MHRLGCSYYALFFFFSKFKNMSEESLWPMLAQESLKALGGLGLLSLGAKYILRRVFEVCMEDILKASYPK